MNLTKQKSWHTSVTTILGSSQKLLKQSNILQNINRKHGYIPYPKIHPTGQCFSTLSLSEIYYIHLLFPIHDTCVKCIPNFGRKKKKGKDCAVDLRVEDKIILE